MRVAFFQNSIILVLFICCYSVYECSEWVCFSNLFYFISDLFQLPKHFFILFYTTSIILFQIGNIIHQTMLLRVTWTSSTCFPSLTLHLLQWIRLYQWKSESKRWALERKWRYSYSSTTVLTFTHWYRAETTGKQDKWHLGKNIGPSMGWDRGSDSHLSQFGLCGVQGTSRGKIWLSVINHGELLHRK